MRNSERLVRDIFVKKGYKFLSRGSPDFVFYKEKDGKISGVIFAEVKSNGSNLSVDQLMYSKILISLNLDYRLINGEEISSEKEDYFVISSEVSLELYDKLKSIAIKKGKDIKELSTEVIIDFVNKNKT